MGRKKSPRPGRRSDIGQGWEENVYEFCKAAAEARRPISAAQLRARIDALDLSYAVVAPWLGLTVDGLHKQLSGARAVSAQTALLFGVLEKAAKRARLEYSRAGIDDFRRETGRLAREARQRIETEPQPKRVMLNVTVTKTPLGTIERPAKPRRRARSLAKFLY